jgi:hypothetical protein
MDMFCDERTGQLSFMPIPPMFSKDSVLWKRFNEFHKRYPQVYENFKVKMQEKIRNLPPGVTFISSYEVRQIMISTDVSGVDNNYAPYYLRTFLEEFPNQEKYFRLRELKMETI